MIQGGNCLIGIIKGGVEVEIAGGVVIVTKIVNIVVEAEVGVEVGAEVDDITTNKRMTICNMQSMQQ